VTPLGLHGVDVAFKTLGCKVNRVESDSIATELIGRGAIVCADEALASVIVVNTCTVTGEADSKARKAVRHALKQPGEPVVVVTGCLAALDAPALRALGDRVIVEADKAVVASRVADALGLGHDRLAPQPAVTAGAGFRTRAALKIEDGCDNFCTYCIVPHARGVPRAVPLDDVVGQATRLVASGAKEIVLTGINIGRYDHEGARLPDVIRAVGVTGIERLRLSSVEPPDLDAPLLEALAETPAVCPHLHVPLQSGSDSILAAMGRTYTSAEFAHHIETARRLIPGLVITTDLIAGFPGETEAEHRESCAFVGEIGFAKLHVFRYSERAGTPAASLPQVAPELRAERASELRRLGEELRSAHLGASRDQVSQVLIESIEAGQASGTSREYVRFVFAAPDGACVGDVVEVVGSAARRS